MRLGPFQEQFRQYLLGLLAFPQDCSLSVVVREGKEIDRLTYAPIGKREGNFHVYKFPMPGLGFSMVVSKNITVPLRSRQNYRANVFLVCMASENLIHRCNDACRGIPHSRRRQDGSGETSRSLKLKDSTTRLNCLDARKSYPAPGIRHCTITSHTSGTTNR